MSFSAPEQWLQQRTVRGYAVLLVLFMGVLCFTGLGVRDIATAHEGQRSVPPLEMLQTGDWIVPRLNGEPYLAKPPLMYWQVAGIYTLLGVSEWTARLSNALAGIATVLVAFFWGRRILKSDWLAFLAALFLSCNLLVLDRARQAQLDMHLCLWTLLAFWAWWEAFRRLKGGTRPTAAILLGGVALAVANMFKFPVPYLFLMTAFGGTIMVLRQKNWLLRWEWIAAHLLGAAPFWIWGVLLAEQLSWERGLSALEQEMALRVQPTPIQREPLWFYLGVSLGGFAPFSLLWLVFGRKAFRREQAQDRLNWVYLLSGGVASVLVLSLVPAKESIYMVSAAPLMCMLLAQAAGWWIDRGPGLSRRARLCLVIVPALIFPLVYLPLAYFRDLSKNEKRSLRPYSELLMAEAEAGRPVLLYRKIERHMLFYNGRALPYAPDPEALDAFLSEHPEALIFADADDFALIAARSEHHQTALQIPDVAGEEFLLVGDYPAAGLDPESFRLLTAHEPHSAAIPTPE